MIGTFVMKELNWKNKSTAPNVQVFPNGSKK